MKGGKAPSPSAMSAKGSSAQVVDMDREFLQALRDHLKANEKDLDALVALGLWLLSREEPGKALECFNRVTRTDPAYPGIWRFKAKAFDAIGDSKSAAQCRLRGRDPHS